MLYKINAKPIPLFTQSEKGGPRYTEDPKKQMLFKGEEAQRSVEFLKK